MGAKPPVARDCPRSLWLLEDKPCLKRLEDDGSISRICDGELGYPKDIVGITLKGYNCERDYQDLIISKCKKWRK